MADLFLGKSALPAVATWCSKLVLNLNFDSTTILCLVLIPKNTRPLDVAREGWSYSQTQNPKARVALGGCWQISDWVQKNLVITGFSDSRVSDQTGENTSLWPLARSETFTMCFHLYYKEMVCYSQLLWMHIPCCSPIYCRKDPLKLLLPFPLSCLSQLWSSHSTRQLSSFLTFPWHPFPWQHMLMNPYTRVSCRRCWAPTQLTWSAAKLLIPTSLPCVIGNPSKNTPSAYTLQGRIYSREQPIFQENLLLLLTLFHLKEKNLHEPPRKITISKSPSQEKKGQLSKHNRVSALWPCSCNSWTF